MDKGKLQGIPVSSMDMEIIKDIMDKKNIKIAHIEDNVPGDMCSDKSPVKAIDKSGSNNPEHKYDSEGTAAPAGVQCLTEGTPRVQCPTDIQQECNAVVSLEDIQIAMEPELHELSVSFPMSFPEGEQRNAVPCKNIYEETNDDPCDFERKVIGTIENDFVQGILDDIWKGVKDRLGSTEKVEIVCVENVDDKEKMNGATEKDIVCSNSGQDEKRILNDIDETNETLDHISKDMEINWNAISDALKAEHQVNDSKIDEEINGNLMNQQVEGNHIQNLVFEGERITVTCHETINEPLGSLAEETEVTPFKHENQTDMDSIIKEVPKRNSVLYLEDIHVSINCIDYLCVPGESLSGGCALNGWGHTGQCSIPTGLGHVLESDIKGVNNEKHQEPANDRGVNFDCSVSSMDDVKVVTNPAHSIVNKDNSEDPVNAMCDVDKDIDATNQAVHQSPVNNDPISAIPDVNVETIAGQVVYKDRIEQSDVVDAAHKDDWDKMVDEIEDTMEGTKLDAETGGKAGLLMDIFFSSLLVSVKISVFQFSFCLVDGGGLRSSIQFIFEPYAHVLIFWLFTSFRRNIHCL